jgi:hypothetical protein
LVTNEQLYIVIGIPMLFNATLIGLVIAYINVKIDKVESKFDSKFDSVNSRFDAVNSRFDAVDQRFDAIDRRFDDMGDLWRAELRRVEEVLDARLKHIEERG